jgi:hypothetical protein
MRFRHWTYGGRFGWGWPNGGAQSVGPQGLPRDCGETTPSRLGVAPAHFSTYRHGLAASRRLADVASPQVPVEPHLWELRV